MRKSKSTDGGHRPPTARPAVSLLGWQWLPGQGYDLTSQGNS
jgi:hypothetical protein